MLRGIDTIPRTSFSTFRNDLKREKKRQWNFLPRRGSMAIRMLQSTPSRSYEQSRKRSLQFCSSSSENIKYYSLSLTSGDYILIGNLWNDFWWDSLLRNKNNRLLLFTDVPLVFELYTTTNTVLAKMNRKTKDFILAGILSQNWVHYKFDASLP